MEANGKERKTLDELMRLYHPGWGFQGHNEITAQDYLRWTCYLRGREVKELSKEELAAWAQIQNEVYAIMQTRDAYLKARAKRMRQQEETKRVAREIMKRMGWERGKPIQLKVP